MFKIGLVGNGSIARCHLSAYERLFKEGKAEVVAFCDIRPERLNKEFLYCFTEARTYESIDEMLEKEAGKLDYIDVCTPTYLHSEHAIKAMKAGFNCLSEKPMARNVQQAEEMIKVSEETGKTLMIAHCCRFHPAAYEVKRIIDSGELGRLLSAEFKREGGSDDGSDWFREYELSGGVTLDYHIHDVDLTRWLLGVPKAVSATGVNVYSRGGGSDIVNANFIYDNMFVNLNANWELRKNRFNVRMMRFNFEKGYVYIERGSERNIAVTVLKDGTETEFSEKLPLDGYFEEIKYFIDCLENGKKTEFNPLEQSLDDVKIVMAEIESVDNGGVLVKTQ